MNMKETINAMRYENLSEIGKEAARVIAMRTGESPEQVAMRTARSFFSKGAVYRERNILPES